MFNLVHKFSSLLLDSTALSYGYLEVEGEISHLTNRDAAKMHEVHHKFSVHLANLMEMPLLELLDHLARAKPLRQQLSSTRRVEPDLLCAQ